MNKKNKKNKKLPKRKSLIQGQFKDKQGKMIKFINDDANNRLVFA